MRPVELRCEYRVNPLGVDVAQPRLSWVLSPVHPNSRGLRQTAYRVLVAASEQSLRAGKGGLWDSGRVPSDQSIHVAYRGALLTSGMRAFWKVQVWDQVGKASLWSQPAFWSMGLLKPEDWKARWIGRDEDQLQKRPGSPYWNLEKARWIWFPEGDPAAGRAPGARFFRASFSVPAGRKITRALCILGADNQFMLFLNGQRVGRGDQLHM